VSIHLGSYLDDGAEVEPPPRPRPAAEPTFRPAEPRRAAYARFAREHGHLDVEVCYECIERRAEYERLRAEYDENPPQPAPAVPSASGPQAAPTSPAPRPAPVHPVDALAAELEAAADDTARAAILAAAPKRTREMLQTRLQYQALMRPTVDPYTAFERGLAAATDDAARTALFAARDARFLSEWRWRATATADSWRRRYLALLGDVPGGE
jgi:hypothetical protein